MFREYGTGLALDGTAIRSIFSTCNALCKEVFRHYPMFRHRSATPAGVTGNGEVRSLGDNVTSILGSAVDARANTATASIAAVGGQQSGVWSTQVKC